MDKKLESISSEVNKLQVRLSVLRKKAEECTASRNDLDETSRISKRLDLLMKEVENFLNKLPKRH